MNYSKYSEKTTLTVTHRPLSRRIPPPSPAETSRAAASRILVGAPARQPKFMGAAAAVFFSACRGASEVNAIRHSYVIAFLVIPQ